MLFRSRPSSLDRLARFFELRRRGASFGGEVRGGVTTFLVMAYIVFVNPAILSFAGIPALEGQGPPFAATQAATCLVAGVMTIAMGAATNYPLAVASGMGLKLVRGKAREMGPIVYLVAGAFAVYFALPAFQGALGAR